MSTTTAGLGLRRDDLLRMTQKRFGARAAAIGYDLDDLVQDSIVRALERAGSASAFDPRRARYSTWFMRVVNDSLRTEFRRHRGRQRLSEALGPSSRGSLEWDA